jgi:hypothetical protein
MIELCALCVHSAFKQHSAVTLQCTCPFLQARQQQRAKPSKGAEWRPLTQAELLVEAARTEIENLHSLKHLLALEVCGAVDSIG